MQTNSMGAAGRFWAARPRSTHRRVLGPISRPIFAHALIKQANATRSSLASEAPPNAGAKLE